MANSWEFELANQKRGWNCLSQSGERRDLKNSDFKFFKVIFLRDFKDLSSRVR